MSTFQDPNEPYLEECQNDSVCKESREILKKCEERVDAGEEDDCDEEFSDFINCVNHLVISNNNNVFINIIITILIFILGK